MTMYASHEFGKVAVMLGGHSAEREVSLKSGHAVLSALLRQGVHAIAFDPAERRLEELCQEGVDRVCIMLHGRGGEDGTLQGALTSMHIPYTGSGVLGSALAMDKIRTKQIWQSLGLPTAQYRVVEPPSYTVDMCDDVLIQLGGEVMVKPAREGSSIGMARVASPQALHTAISAAFEFDPQVLVEQFVRGQEYTVSIVGEAVLPSIRMSTPNQFYDYSAKYQSNSTSYYCPSGLNEEDETRLGMLAYHAFRAVDGAGWGRVDAMRDQNGQFFLLEVNTVPGMTEKSLVPKAAAAAGIDFDTLVMQILATSMEAK